MNILYRHVHQDLNDRISLYIGEYSSFNYDFRIQDDYEYTIVVKDLYKEKEYELDGKYEDGQFFLRAYEDVYESFDGETFWKLLFFKK